MNASQYPGTGPQNSDQQNLGFQNPGPQNPGSQAAGGRAGAPSGRQSTATTAIAVSTAVVGGIALFVTGTSAAFGDPFSGPGFGPWSGVVDQGEDWVDETVDDGSIDDGSGDQGMTGFDSMDVTGVTDVEVDVAAAALTIQFGDVEFAELETSHGEDFAWNFSVEGSTLKLESPDDGLSVTRGCLFGCSDSMGDDARRVTLTLPQSLAERGELDADVSVAAGTVRMDGSFRDLGIDVQTGEVSVDGTARSLDLDVSTGTAKVSLVDVESAEANIETGQAEIVLGGEAPASVDVGVDLGSLTVELPAEKYRVDIEDGPSKVQNGLDTDRKSKHRVSAELGAGELVLR